MTAPAASYSAEAYSAEFVTASTALSASSARLALQAYVLWRMGKDSDLTWAARLVGILVSFNARATTLGDVLAARSLVMLERQDVRPVGLGYPVEPEAERLSEAVATLARDLDTTEDLSGRIERLAEAEPANTLQQSTLQAYDAHGITGYTRHLEPGACELCHWLRKEHLREGGYVYPTDKPMHKHPGCRCTPVPVTEEVRHARTRRRAH